MIAVRRFDAWRAAVSLVAAASIASLLAWTFLAPLGQSGVARIAVGLAALAIVALAGSLWRVPGGDLRWDGSCWSFTPLGETGAAPGAGELEVSVDLGSFMLLRFTPVRRVGRASVRWIPIERRGHEREWHAFRCAVYSPPPVAGMTGSADSAPLR